MEATSPPVSPGPEADCSPHRIPDPANPPRELSGLAWGVYVCLGILAILALVKILVAGNLHAVADDGGSFREIHDAYRSYAILTTLWELGVLVSGGVFIAWFFRAYKNLARLGVANLRFRSGWAIGAWFVPIFNMIRPKQIANDIWRGSEPGVDTSVRWRLEPVPSLVHWWWGLFLVQWIVIYIGQQLTTSGYHRYTVLYDFDSGLSKLGTGTVIEILGSIAAVAGAVLAIKVVARMTERLDWLRAEALREER